MTDGRILWANLLYLFVLSFQPVTTGWVGRSNFATLPVRVYVLVALACSGRYVLLEKAVTVLMIAKNMGEVGRILIAHQGPHVAYPELWVRQKGLRLPDADLVQRVMEGALRLLAQELREMPLLADSCPWLCCLVSTLHEGSFLRSYIKGASCQKAGAYPGEIGRCRPLRCF